MGDWKGVGYGGREDCLKGRMYMMCKKNLILISGGKKELLGRWVGEKVEGLGKLKDYGVGWGDVDFESLENDGEDLKDEGWREVGWGEFMDVKV